MMPKNPLCKIISVRSNGEVREDIRCRVEPWARGKNIVEVAFYREPNLKTVRVLAAGMKARIPTAQLPHWRDPRSEKWRTDSILRACSEVA